MPPIRTIAAVVVSLSLGMFTMPASAQLELTVKQYHHFRQVAMDNEEVRLGIVWYVLGMLEAFDALERDRKSGLRLLCIPQANLKQMAPIFALLDEELELPEEAWRKRPDQTIGAFALAAASRRYPCK
jgi:hypothetical protein